MRWERVLWRRGKVKLFVIGISCIGDHVCGVQFAIW